MAGRPWLLASSYAEASFLALQSELTARDSARVDLVVTAGTSRVADRAMAAVRKAALIARARAIATHAMYARKEIFDRAAAAQLLRTQGGCIAVGMWGSARDTFRASRRTDGFNVLNFVNAHPSRHNSELAASGLRRHHERVPAHMTDRIDEELALSDLVVVPSIGVRDDLASRGVSPDRLISLPYGVDLDRFAFTPGAVGAPGPLRVLFVGQISHRKGVDDLVSAARNLQGAAEFRLVGPLVSPEVLRGASPNVHVTSTLSPHLLPDLYASSDVFLLPSIEDTFGLVVLEALACGLPVITTTAVGAGEVLTEACGWVVEPRSPSQIINALSAAASLSARAETRVAARQLAESYPWTRFTAGVINEVERRI